MNLVFNGEFVLYVFREKNSNRLPMSLEQNSLISSLYKLCFFFYFVYSQSLVTTIFWWKSLRRWCPSRLLSRLRGKAPNPALLKC